MAIRVVEIEEFIKLSLEYPVLDVRSPGEYEHAHIPNAYCVALFDDHERAVVGTIYKRQSREDAIKKGLEFFGKKMLKIVEEVEEINKKLKDKNNKTVLIHCWRGGMRSAGVAWLLDLYGFKVMSLKGGYKSFRNWTIKTLAKPFPFKIIGGYTGSGKTEILQELKTKFNHFTIDLEGIARHKGSAFGAIGQKEQPSQEMFENVLTFELFKIISNEIFNSRPVIFIEDESQRIGTLNIPQDFWVNLRTCQTIFLEIPFSERLQYITKHYGKLDRSQLAAAITRIQKRLGGLETKQSLGHLLDENYESCFEILLKYYDKLYNKAIERKVDIMKDVVRVQCDHVDCGTNTSKILSKTIDE